MQRAVVGICCFVIGLAIGVAVMLLADSQYEYALARSRGDLSDYVNHGGWEIAPHQPDPFFVRRSRLHR